MAGAPGKEPAAAAADAERAPGPAARRTQAPCYVPPRRSNDDFASNM